MPVIPGSEIRGMFRNNFEILTNSCMSSLDSDMSLSKRTLESFSAGLLHRVEKNNETRFDLFEAKDVLWRTEGENNTKTDLEWRDSKKTRKCYIQEDYKEGEIVNYTEISRMSNGKAIKPLADDVQKYNSKLSTYKIGYIIKGEEGPKKHCCHIFRVNKLEPKCKNIKISLLDELLDIYEKIRWKMQVNTKNIKKNLQILRREKVKSIFQYIIQRYLNHREKVNCFYHHHVSLEKFMIIHWPHLQKNLNHVQKIVVIVKLVLYLEQWWMMITLHRE